MHNQPGGAPPVFVDRTGRRRRVTVVAGTAMGLGLLTSLGLIAAGLFGGSSVPMPGWSDSRMNKPIEAGVDGVDGVDGLGSSPTPAARPSPSASTSAPVRPEPTRTVTGAPTVPGNNPQVTDRPGQGEDRRTAKPGRSPGRPG